MTKHRSIEEILELGDIHEDSYAVIAQTLRDEGHLHESEVFVTCEQIEENYIPKSKLQPLVEDLKLIFRIAEQRFKWKSDATEDKKGYLEIGELLSKAIKSVVTEIEK